MLLDINAYVGHWPFKRLKYTTCSARLERMNKYGIHQSVISNLNGIFYKNTQSANEELYDEIRSEKNFEGRFIPFAVINPIYAGWREDMDVCIKKMGMKGVRLHPQYHDYEITDTSLIELVKRARDYGVPVAFDIRMFDSRQKSWMEIPLFNQAKDFGVDVIRKEWQLGSVVPIIKAVPDAKYIIVNLANIVKLSDEESEIFKNADVVFDTSGRHVKDNSSLAIMIRTYGKEKFAFGSHSPVLDYLSGLLRIETLNDSEADPATKELLRSGNAKRIIGIQS